MKAYLLLILVSLLPLGAHAVNQEKKINVGIGTYTLKISYDPNKVPFDDDFNGAGISGLYALSNKLAVRGEIYSVEHLSFSSIKASGLDLVGYYGTGLTAIGPKAYIGGGIFLDRWSIAGKRAEFNGLEINGGAGYNWNKIAFDFIVSARDPGDYNHAKSVSGGGTRAVTISVLVSARY